MTPEDIRQVESIVTTALAKANERRHEDLFNELQPIRLFLKRVDDDLYGREGETGIVKLIVRHDTLLWVLVALAILALAGIFALLVRG